MNRGKGYVDTALAAKISINGSRRRSLMATAHHKWKRIVQPQPEHVTLPVRLKYMTKSTSNYERCFKVACK